VRARESVGAEAASHPTIVIATDLTFGLVAAAPSVVTLII